MLKSYRHYHYIDGEECETYVFEDGIVIFETGGTAQWTPCAHVDFPFDSKEMIESHLKEKRNYPFSAEKPSLTFMDI